MDVNAAELIEQAMKVAGSLPDLADRIAWKERTLRRVRSGEVPLSDKLRFNLEKVISQALVEAATSNVIAEPAAKYGRSTRPRLIPVFSFVQAGQATNYEALPAEQWEDQVEYDGTDEKAFALRVAGDSMEPRFPAGTIITVSPKNPPNPGKPVVACLKNDEGVLFKIFHHSGDGTTVTLTSYNSGTYPAITRPREDFHWIYRVVKAEQRL